MSLRHALLGLLAIKSASGYDLLRTFETSLAQVWPATQSQVYGELGKLTTAGLTEVSTCGPRGRKEYAITTAGRQELRDWLLEPQPPRVVRSAALLRFFFLGQLDRTEAAAMLHAEVEWATQYLAQLRAIETMTAKYDDELSRAGRLVLDYGISNTTAHREWARRTRQHFAAEADQDAGSAE